jgi:hypothetical protein
MFDCAQPEDYCVQELVVHVASYHFNRDADLNEFNPGLGLRLRVPERSFFAAVGAFENSLSHLSVYAGIGKDFPLAGPLGFRLSGALITGYHLPVAPIILPELTMRAGSYGLAVGYMPRLEFEDSVVESFLSFSLIKHF